MKKGRFTEDQIIGLLKQQVGGRTTAEVGREEGISAATFYQWKAKFGGMSVCDAQRLQQLEAENAKLHRVVANQGLDVVALQDVLSKNGDAERSASAPAAKREVAGYLQEHHGRSQRKASALIGTSPSVLRRQRETGGAEVVCVGAEAPALGPS